MAGYLDTVSKDIARWRAAGLIDEATATALSADAAAHHRRSFSFGGILAILAAALFGAALLLLVAANWEAIPRLVRVAGIFIETHQDPDNSPSHGPNMIYLAQMPALVASLMRFDALAKSDPVMPS